MNRHFIAQQFVKFWRLLGDARHETVLSYTAITSEAKQFKLIQLELLHEHWCRTLTYFTYLPTADVKKATHLPSGGGAKKTK